METLNIKQRVEIALSKDIATHREMILEIFEDFLVALESGQIRTADKINGIWSVNSWIKKAILLGFKLGEYRAINTPFSFVDKDIYPLQDFTEESGIRVVPPSSGIRRGAYVARGAVLMPPAYVNVGAFVDENTMVEGLVGSCAQIGKNVHLSAGTVVGGVLEPIEASPVIIENDVLLGEGAGITQGTRVMELATIAPGVHISAGTAVFDTIKNLAYSKEGTHKLETISLGTAKAFKLGKLIDKKDSSFGPIIPAGALVISGLAVSSTGFFKYAPIITKYIHNKADRTFALEEALR